MAARLSQYLYICTKFYSNRLFIFSKKVEQSKFSSTDMILRLLIQTRLASTLHKATEHERLVQWVNRIVVKTTDTKFHELNKTATKNKRKTLHRNISVPKLDYIIKIHLKDPLIWNLSVLSRIFKIDEEIMKGILEYVKPMVFYIDHRHEDFKQLIEFSEVVDVERLQNDKTYLKTYYKFIDSGKNNID